MRCPLVLVLALLLALPSCSFFVPESRTPSDRARALEPKCAGVATELPPSRIERVEPAYAHVLGGPNDREARLRGARIHLRPSAGATAESLTRALECHQAAVVLGKATAPDSDPFVLPGRWLTIEVRSDGDGFVASLETDDRDDAAAVLARARACVGRQELVPPSVGDAGAPASTGAGGQPSPRQNGLVLDERFAGQQ
jgi:hypothetical protein